MWLAKSKVTRRKAALLLCGLDPGEDKLDPLSINTISITAGTTAPNDFAYLMKVFQMVEQADAAKQDRTLKQWREIARGKKVRKNSWIDEYDEALRLTSNETEGESKATGKGKGVGKQGILAAEWPLINNYSQSSLERALGEVPKWLKSALVAKGARGKGKGSSTWNPVLIAVCLADRGYAKQQALKKTIAAYFPDWSDELEHVQDFK